MKVLLINGSPHEKGCTFTALSEVSKVLEEEKIETELFWIGNKPVQGCVACGQCLSNTSACAFDDDVNLVIQKMKQSDGLVLGAPVHYAAVNGAMTSFCDRLFHAQKTLFSSKPGAAVVSARRAGTTAALDQLNRYFPIVGMPVVPSQYWSMVHGNRPDEVLQDLEGLQTLRFLGRNMAWMIKAFDLAKKSGIPAPEREEPRQRTNFIR